MNYFAPFTLSVSIHIGLVLSFSNYFNINFNQFNIESIKPVAAYIVFENYEIILKWNRSLRFSLAVCTLKEKFENEL